MSLVIKLGALAFVIVLPVKFAIQFQLLGGIWIVQIFPPVILGLYARWMRREALIAGWIVGTGLGTWMVAAAACRARSLRSIFSATCPATPRSIRSSPMSRW